MISRKESFVCIRCKEENPVIPANERNHCRKCLYSLHVDEKIPGDRKSTCKAEMKPIFVAIDTKKGYIITHLCTACGSQKRNKAAPDDSIEIMSELI